MAASYRPIRGILKGTGFRQVVKVVIATVLAYAIALGGRDEYALFSALGAALVVGGSVGEDLRSSLNRVRGTLAGAAVGMGAVYALGNSIGALCIAIGGVAWVSLGLGWGAAAMRVGFAMALVVLFSHDPDTMSYAIWRVLYSLLGIAIGLGVSLTLWPIRARQEIGEAIARARAATAATLETLAEGVAPEPMLARQVELLDSLSAIRVATRHARAEKGSDAWSVVELRRARLAARAAIAALGASVKVQEIPPSELSADGLEDLRRVLGTLAAAARNGTELPVEVEARGAPVGVLADLRQVERALRSLREAKG